MQEAVAQSNVAVLIAAV